MRFKLPALGLFAALALQAHAIDFIATNSYIVASNQVVAEEQWVFANVAKLEGSFKNDLFIIASDELELNGSYDGNIWGYAPMASKLNGNCERNVRLMSWNTLQIEGTVNGNLLAFSKTITLGSNTTVEGSVKLSAMNSIVQEGAIKGDASFSSWRIVTLGGTIDGDVAVSSPDILLSRDTRILGNLTYTANKELVPAEGMVAGKIERVYLPSPFSKERLASRAMWFFAALLAGVPFISLFPMTTAMASQLVRTSPWKCLWVGGLCALALPVFGIMGISSVIGVPLGSLILGGWGFMVYTSRIIMGLVIGMLILRSKSTSIGGVMLSMATGLAVIYIATAIPAISLSVQIVVTSMGMGALLLGLFQKRRLIIQVPEELRQLEELKKQNITEKQEDKQWNKSS